MTLSDWLQIAGFVVTLFGGFWALSRNIQKQFETLTRSQQQNYLQVTNRLTGIETTVSPYAQDISILKQGQSENMVQIAELQSLKNDVDRLQREVETLRNRAR